MCLWSKQTKPNQTQSKQTKHHLFCLFVQTVYRNQTKPNLLNNKFNIKCLKSKVPEKLARAAQLLYRSVLVSTAFIKSNSASPAANHNHNNFFRCASISRISYDHHSVTTSVTPSILTSSHTNSQTRPN